MARAFSTLDTSDPATGDWQALRGELVALLDKVESRYTGPAAPDPGNYALSQRVRNLRDQVEAPEPALRRREALRSVKQAVDRFSERDAQDMHEEDELTAAIAEIRRRQGPAPVSVMGRRASDMPDFRDLNALVSGMSLRLEQLEGHLRNERDNEAQVKDVAEQVEQLTQVVELLAGAVGETGQVKRLEAQIAALGDMIENAPKVDLGAINQRLDDVSATVGKLAELQAEQMEREIVREERRATRPEPAAALTPVVRSIEESVRNVYDRIDAIERNFAMSSNDFEKLTSEMASFTQAITSDQSAPAALVRRIEALAETLESADTTNQDVAALRQDMVSLREAVLVSMEPRFAQIEDRIEALSDKIVPVDTSVVETQLHDLMSRMDAASVQLEGLSKLYNSAQPDFDSLATMVAERTTDAMQRNAPAQAPGIDPDSLKAMEERLSDLIKSSDKQPEYDYETLADLVADKTSAAVAKTASVTSAEIGPDSIDALEKRMTAILNTAGKDTADRLRRLEARLATSQDRRGAPAPTLPTASVEAARPAPAAPAPAPQAKHPPEAATPARDNSARLDSILAGLLDDKKDAMPASPAEEAPLIDRGFRDAAPAPALSARAASVAEPSRPLAQPTIDTSQIERPPRPQSSFAQDSDPFASPAPAKPPVEAPKAQANTSTFVAAARRAQRARQDEVQAASGTMVARALSRVRHGKPADEADSSPAEAQVTDDAREEWPAPESREEEKPAKQSKADKRAAAKQEREAARASAKAEKAEAMADRPGFLTRNRRPLLLAATLAAVSVLALNLVLQRANTPPQRPVATSKAVIPADEVPTPAAAPEAAAPAATERQAAAVPTPIMDAPATEPKTERLSDAVDPTSTQSINPSAMSVMNATNTATLTPMPPALMADGLRSSDFRVPALPEDAKAPESTGSISGTVAAQEPAPRHFELPPEKVGPEALRQAAANGDARAQFEIGAIYTEGQAVEQDLKLAATWYERAAEMGFVPAQYRLGNLFEAGTGVEKDLEKARMWYERAAEGGNRMAMHNLAALYAGGQLGEQQFETAAEWFEKAADRGMLDSQFNLGMLYARGLGVEQDFETSYRWFSIAALTGDKDAAQAKDDIAKSLTADAVNRINDEVAGWKPQQIDLAANFAPIGTWSADFDPGKAIENRDVVARVQMALNKLGFDAGDSDGLVGPKTVEAVKAFERGAGMSESGEINPRLLAVLGSQPV